MHRQDFWTRRTQKLRVYSQQVNASFRIMSGNTTMELQSWKIWSSKFYTTRTLTPRTWINLKRLFGQRDSILGRRYRSDSSVGKWGRRSGCNLKAVQKTCLEGLEAQRAALGREICWGPALWFQAVQEPTSFLHWSAFWLVMLTDPYVSACPDVSWTWYCPNLHRALDRRDLYQPNLRHSHPTCLP